MSQPQAKAPAMPEFIAAVPLSLNPCRECGKAHTVTVSRIPTAERPGTPYPPTHRGTCAESGRVIEVRIGS